MMQGNILFLKLLHWIVSALSLMLTAYFVRGFKIKSFGSALVASLIIGFANIFIRPILLFLTFPLNIVTLGLFTFVVDGIILKLCAAFLPGFDIEKWGSAIFGAFVLAIVSMGLHYFLI